MRSVTPCDVVDRAGISYRTVSRVVNQASHVSAKARQKVEAAMAELNYVPNRVAQQLAGKQTPLTGVVTVNLALRAPSRIAAAIKSRTDQSSASVVIATVERSGVRSHKTTVRSLLSQRVTGLIINYPLNEENAIAVAAACGTVPVLLLDVSDLAPISSVIFSHGDDARLGVGHLVQHGHQRVVLLNGPYASVSARFRHVGWYRYLVHYQLQPVAGLEGDQSAVSGFQQTMHMLNNGNLPTVVLVANDQMTLDMMRAVGEFGLRVVVDTSVVGYGDTGDSVYYIPPLTTIRQDFPLLGEISVDRLPRLPRGESTAGSQLLPVTLVKHKAILPPDTQITAPQALAGSLIQLARQVSQLAPKL